jgi:muramoyltetrapeptide carboxypeptidase
MAGFRGGLSRRNVLGAGAFTSGGLLVPGAPARAAAGRVVRPPMLRPGDRVRVVSPGSTPDPEQVERGVEILRSWGLDVELGGHVFDRYGYLAGRDEHRLADLQEALDDPDVRGVFAARGGYGTQRIVDRLDLRGVRRRPKVVVGFSDITSLQARLWRAARLVTFQGPMVAWNDDRTGAESAESLRAAVMTTRPVVLTRDPAETSAAVMVPGRARGPLLGGNLSLVDAAVGAGDLPVLRGAVFFLEEVGEAPYRMDRMLTHLRRAGALKGVRGVVIGQITDSVGEPGEWDAVGVLRDRLGDLGVPVLGGLRLGHGRGQLTVPLGARAAVDASAGTLTVEAGVTDDR